MKISWISISLPWRWSYSEETKMFELHMKNGIILLIISLLFTITLQAQQKIEREYRLKQADVPTEAKSFLEEIFANPNKIKWYKEESQTGVTIEAKKKEKEGLYSIKFSLAGELLDTELTQKFSQLPQDAQKRINDYLQTTYKRAKIRKVQLQWLAPPEIITNLIKGEKPSGTYTTNYEIEFSGNKDGQVKLYETLFDQTGKPLDTKEIVQRNLHHLLY